jgi:hypothetical protein
MAFPASSAQRRRRRPPVIILGAHRSGTTATARALELLGLQIGQRLDSHGEPRGMRALHDRYLQSCAATWYAPTALLDSIQTPNGEQQCTEYLRRNMRDHFPHIFGYRKNPRGLWLLARINLGAAWGWKEPRTILFAASWLQLFPDARVVHIIRHPLAAAQSIRQRELSFRAAGDSPNVQLGDLDYCLQLVFLYIDAGERLAGRARNYRRIRFEEVQANPRAALRDLADFCGLRFTAAQLEKAAASIRPDTSSPWRDIPEESARVIRSRYPALARLGYEKQKQTG